MTEGTRSSGFSEKQGNEAKECYTLGLLRTRKRHGKGILATESESQRQDYGGALLDSVTSFKLVSRDEAY